MELVTLERYEPGSRLGTGADYEVRTAVDRETGNQVVLKRPVPQMIRLNQHGGAEARYHAGPTRKMRHRLTGKTSRYQDDQKSDAGLRNGNAEPVQGFTPQIASQEIGTKRVGGARRQR